MEWIDIFGCCNCGKELKNKINSVSGLSISIALAQNKMVLQAATGEAKPNNSRQILPNTEIQFLDPMLVGKIPMIGKETSELVHARGVKKVETLRQVPKKLMEYTFGKNEIVILQRA